MSAAPMTAPVLPAPSPDEPVGLLDLRPLVLPRVDLLPPEIAAARRFRQVQTGLAGAVVAAVGLVALLYVGAVGSATAAEGSLDAAAATAGQLQAQVTGFRDVTAVYGRADAAKATLASAMGQEVRWSRLLNDLSLTVPDNVWLKDVQLTEAAATPAAGGAAPAPAGAATGSLGTATFSGVGFSHEDVAVWLEQLAGQKGFRDPTFTSSTESLLGARKIVSFTSSVTLTPDALSGRYTRDGS